MLLWESVWQVLNFRKHSISLAWHEDWKRFARHSLKVTKSSHQHLIRRVVQPCGEQLHIKVQSVRNSNAHSVGRSLSEGFHGQSHQFVSVSVLCDESVTWFLLSPAYCLCTISKKRKWKLAGCYLMGGGSRVWLWGEGEHGLTKKVTEVCARLVLEQIFPPCVIKFC